MALFFVKWCPFFRKSLDEKINEEAEDRFRALATRYDEADREAMAVALELRHMTEQEFKLVAQSAQCVLWHANVRDPGGDQLNWDLRVFAEELGAFMSIHDVPEEYKTGAWYHGRREEDMFRLARHATAAIRGGAPGYVQEFQCLSPADEPVWFQEDVKIESHGDDIYELYGVSTDITERKKAQEKLEQLVKELQEALVHVKQLRGMLPICAGCKKIRDDSGYWSRIETYFKDHADVEFSHGLCPDCMDRLYPGVMDDDDEDGDNRSV